MEWNFVKAEFERLCFLAGLAPCENRLDDFVDGGVVLSGEEYVLTGPQSALTAGFGPCVSAHNFSGKTVYAVRFPEMFSAEMSRDAVTFCLAHELGHILNGDVFPEGTDGYNKFHEAYEVATSYASIEAKADAQAIRLTGLGPEAIAAGQAEAYAILGKARLVARLAANEPRRPRPPAEVLAGIGQSLSREGRFGANAELVAATMLTAIGAVWDWYESHF